METLDGFFLRVEEMFQQPKAEAWKETFDVCLIGIEENA